MGVFSFINKKKLLELQNLLFNDNSTKLHYDRQALLNIAGNKAKEIIQRTQQLVNEINTTIIPSVFFDSYNTVVSNLEYLSSFDGFVDFTGKAPREEVDYLKSVEDTETNKLINRCLNKSCEIIGSLPITDMQKAYEQFYSLFDGYIVRLSTKNLDYIKKDCKRKIIDTVVNAKDDSTNKRRNNTTDEKILSIIQRAGTIAENDTYDSLMNDAIRVVLSAGQASTGLIQKELKIGYARAGRMLDDMERIGIVGPHRGSAPRQLLITYAEWKERNPLQEEERIKKNRIEEENQLFALFEVICEKKAVKEEDVIKMLLGVDTDYSDDGYFINNLDNYIIPKSDDSTQTQFLNNILKSASSQMIRLLLIDEGLTYNNYKDVPHLLVPIISETIKAVGAINWLNSELRQRQRICAEYQSKGIDSFNELVIKNQELVTNHQPNMQVNGLAVPTERMTHIVVIISEFYNMKSIAEIDESLISVLLNGKRFGIYIYLFSKFAMKNLSLGVKADLLKTGDADDLHEIFVKGVSTYRNISIEKIDNDMNGYQFEVFCGDLLQKNGFSKIKVTQSSADYGADVIAYRDGVKYAIQCKKYSSPVGITAIQEVVASKSMYDCHVGVVLTNNSFTSSAVTLANKTGVLLWGREKLIEMMSRGKE